MVPGKYVVAETWRRVLAYLVDQFIVLVFLTPVWIQFLASWLDDRTLQISWSWLILCLSLVFSYHVLFLKFLRATVGKLIFGLRVVDVHGADGLSWYQCVLRVLTDYLSFFFSLALRVLALFRFDRRHVSDWVAETQVVQVSERTTLARPHAILASLLFGYFLFSGFFSAYRLIQRSEWNRETLTVHGPESGLD